MSPCEVGVGGTQGAPSSVVQRRMSGVRHEDSSKVAIGARERETRERETEGDEPKTAVTPLLPRLGGGGAMCCEILAAPPLAHNPQASPTTCRPEPLPTPTPTLRSVSTQSSST
jgi:hypothetical protein